MTIYDLYKQNPGKTEREYVGQVELFEDDYLTVHTKNKKGLDYEVAGLQEGVDL